MVGIGFAMLAVGLWYLVARWNGTLFNSRALHRTAVVVAPSGFAAVLAGWFTTEVGRQPFTVYGILRTADSVAPVATACVAVSLLVFIVVYFTVFGAGILYMLRLMVRNPDGTDDIHMLGISQTASHGPIHALSAATQREKEARP